MKHEQYWRQVKLGELVEFKNGINYRASDVGERVKLVGVSSFQNSFYLNEELLDEVEIASLKEDYLLEDGDFLFVRSNGNKKLIGRVLYIEKTENPITFSGFTIRARNKSEDVLDKYCAIFMSSNLVKKQFMTMGGGSNINNLNQNILSNIFINLPPKNEQSKILEILSAWDNAIELKEQLIEQKQLQKKGLMQKVLTGDVRLPGFESEWEKVSLEKLGQLKTSSVNKKSDSEEIPISLVNYMDVYKNGMIDETINYMQVTATKKQIETFKVNYGDVLFTPSSETPDDIGHSAVVKVNKEKLLFSYHLIRLQFYKDLDINFKAYVFNSSFLLKDFARKSTGSTRYTLSLKDFKESEVKIPSDYEEQKAIGELLLNVDKEIELRQRELKKLKQQKTGLMQQLLTGEVRVNV